MKFTHKLLTASLLAVGATATNAAPMYFNTGIDIDGNIPFGSVQDADTITTFNEFNNFNPNATSVYTERAGFQDGILNSGEIMDFTDNGTVIISSLADQFGTTLLPGLTSMEGFNASWNLEMVYSVSGYSTASFAGAPINMSTTPLGSIFGPGQGLIPTFLTGTIEFKYNVIVAGALFNIPGLADGDKVLQLDLVNGQPDIANLVLDGTVDYSWFTDSGDAKSTSIKNMFNFVTPVFGKNSFYDIWEAGDSQTPKLATVLWDVSTNVDPNLIPRSGGVGNYEVGGATPTAACAPGTFCRTTGLNLDVQFNPIPEPDTLFLLGIGILGLSYSVSRKAKA